MNPPHAYRVYRLTLPSGEVVRVRKPATAQLLAAGAYAFPLLSAALEIAKPSDDALPSLAAQRETIISHLRGLASLALCESDYTELLTVADLYAVVRWVLAIDTGDAVLEGEQAWAATDLLPFVQSSAAILVDRICERYGISPAALVEVPAALAVDFNLAVGYRGLRRESDSVNGEVEAEDMWGNVHKVPANWLATHETTPGARIIRPEKIAADTGRPLAFTVGGSVDGVTAK